MEMKCAKCKRRVTYLKMCVTCGKKLCLGCWIEHSHVFDKRNLEELRSEVVAYCVVFFCCGIGYGLWVLEFLYSPCWIGHIIQWLVMAVGMGCMFLAGKYITWDTVWSAIGKIGAVMLSGPAGYVAGLGIYKFVN